MGVVNMKLHILVALSLIAVLTAKPAPAEVHDAYLSEDTKLQLKTSISGLVNNLQKKLKENNVKVNLNKKIHQGGKFLEKEVKKQIKAHEQQIANLQQKKDLLESQSLIEIWDSGVKALENADAKSVIHELLNVLDKQMESKIGENGAKTLKDTVNGIGQVAKGNLKEKLNAKGFDNLDALAQQGLSKIQN